MGELKASTYKRFEDIKSLRADGGELRSARELSSALGCTQCRNVAKGIGKALIARKDSRRDVICDFAEVSKIVDAGATLKPIKDYERSRYSCYLIMQSGDPRKEVIALGQTYLAIQTCWQEIADRRNQFEDGVRRLVAHGGIKQWNPLLAEAAHDAEITSNEEFVYFCNAGYRGLYEGLTVEDIYQTKDLAVRDPVLPLMENMGLIAAPLCISQTEEKLQRDTMNTPADANVARHAAGYEVRSAMERVGGVMPEDLPVLEKEPLAVLKRSVRKNPLVLDA